VDTLVNTWVSPALIVNHIVFDSPRWGQHQGRQSETTLASAMIVPELIEIKFQKATLDLISDD